MHHDAAMLLRAEHAVARVLAEAGDEATAYARLLAAIGESLGWEVGALWTPAGGPSAALRCAATWPGDEPFERASARTILGRGQGLPGRVWASGEPAWIADVPADPNFPRAPSAALAGLRSALCFPITGSSEVLGAIEFFASAVHEPDPDLLATLTSIGGRIGHAVERWHGESRLRESDARKTAILAAAFDAIITMDGDGRVVEVNPATERTFGYAASEMVGRELAELIIPESLREEHRRGVARYVATGEGALLGHPVELPAMRADGSEFPVEIAITQPRLDGPPQFTGFVRDVTHRKRDEEALRSLAEEQAALRRVATAVASEADQARLFAVVTEEVGRLLGANSANTLRFESEREGLVVGAWSTGGVHAVPVGIRLALDGPTVSGQILRTGRPARVDDFERVEGSTAEMLRRLGFRSAVGAPIMLAGRLWGAVMISTKDETPFPAGAERRVASFAELVALALANAEARAQVAASRARVIEAGDAERRRIERNLHDGAQQRLVGLSLLLRLASKQLPEGSADARRLLERADAELAEALQELRELARGIHPAVLSDRGLAPALEALAARASIPVEVRLELDRRLPRTVEAAAYYIVAEALTNASKHACASRVQVRVTRADGTAVVDVTDDGTGGADPAAGSGLRGLADRVEALGGTLELESPPGAGTILRARLSCEQPG
ncbi:MAG TPA: GAF domain-containing protein [Solirubrobacteraceae bacterium]|nr:GAF domain-containing protein [Solirubrobacteraceae bacterium]